MTNYRTSRTLNSLTDTWPSKTRLIGNQRHCSHVQMWPNVTLESQWSQSVKASARPAFSVPSSALPTCAQWTFTACGYFWRRGIDTSTIVLLICPIWVRVFMANTRVTWLKSSSFWPSWCTFWSTTYTWAPRWTCWCVRPSKLLSADIGGNGRWQSTLSCCLFFSSAECPQSATLA